MNRKLKLAGTVLSCIIIFQTVSYASAATYEESKHAADINVQKYHSSAITDPTASIYHLRAPSEWINDPCGLFYFNSSFHVFCQSNPWGSEWGNMSWSHIVSVPNKKWNYKWFYPKDGNQIKTTALIPSLDQNSADKDGIFTGCVMVLPFKEKDKNGKEITEYYPTAFYTGVWGIGENKQEVVCMARALDANKVDEHGNLIDPYLTNWTKYSSTSKTDPNSFPDIIIHQPEELDLVSFRDPYIFTLPDDNSYYILVSGGVKNKKGKPTGAILVFKNDGKDLTKNWERVNKGRDFFFSGPVAVKDPVTRGGDFECGSVHKLTDHIGTTNNTPYVVCFGQDGPATPYGKAGYYSLGNIEKSDKGIHFIPLKNFVDKEGKHIYKHLDLNPEFIFYSANTISVDNEQRKYLMGWLNLGSQANDGKDYNWAGVLSSPRFLYAYQENNEWKMAQEPVLITALRDEKTLHMSTIKFADDIIESKPLKGVKGRYLNIVSIFDGKNLSASTFGVKVVCNDKRNTDIMFKNGLLIVGSTKNIDYKLPKDASKIGLSIFLDGSCMEIFISKEVNNVLIPYAVYSAPLPNNGNLNNEVVKVHGADGITAQTTVYKMNSCWSEQPNLKNKTISAF